eukprot:SAG11_NODE_2587_length_3194_cov_2.322456_4_plen_102_part_00
MWLDPHSSHSATHSQHMLLLAGMLAKRVASAWVDTAERFLSLLASFFSFLQHTKQNVLPAIVFSLALSPAQAPFYSSMIKALTVAVRVPFHILERSSRLQP